MGRRTAWGVALACCVAAATGCYAAPKTTEDATRKPAIRVTSYEDGATVRFPVPLLRGSLADEAATSAKLARGGARKPFVDFAPHFPANERSNVAGYALRVIRCENRRKVRVCTGSDDALRLWLNGELIQQVLELRGAVADSEAAAAELRRGENRLLVEVSQGGGAWGLILRIEDSDGTSLAVTDDGTLVPAGQATK